MQGFPPRPTNTPKNSTAKQPTKSDPNVPDLSNNPFAELAELPDTPINNTTSNNHSNSAVNHLPYAQTI